MTTYIMQLQSAMRVVLCTCNKVQQLLQGMHVVTDSWYLRATLSTDVGRIFPKYTLTNDCR